MVKRSTSVFMARGRQLACFVVCLMLMTVVAISRDSRLFGIQIPKDDEASEEVDPVSIESDGTVIVNTTSLTPGIIGYRGTTPVAITLRNDTIVKIKVLSNNETPEYLGAVLNSDLLEKWDGVPLGEASEVKPDAVSGATITSTALIKNIETGISYAQNSEFPKNSTYEAPLDYKFFCCIALILAAAILPLFLKGKLYRNVQLVLNVIILGFWGGTFISYSLMTSLTANGIKSWLMIPMLIMIVTAFIYPFFGKKNYYCTWICPYGSIQDLAGQGADWLAKKGWWWQLKVSSRTAKALGWFRDSLWVALMWLMMAGLWFEWMDWEPFSAFFFKDTSPIVLGIAGGFLLLSLFIRRPYCRFVCPTGTLFKISEGNS